MSLKERVAIITGSSSGIGAGIAECFAKEGAKLSLTGRNDKQLMAVAERCKDIGCNDILMCVGDITRDDVRQTLIRQTIEKFGKIDILVNNAGILLPAPVIEATEEDYDSVFNTNLKAPFMLTSLAARHLIESKGCIVNISSVGSVTSAPGMGVYCMTKAAMDSYTEHLALEMGSKGVRANSVNPGFITTQICSRGNVPEDVAKEKKEGIIKATALGRSGTPEEIGNAVVFLASGKASYLTGSILIADGGVRLTPGY